MPTITPRFYPSLSSLVELDSIGKYELPEPIAQGIEGFFDKIFVKDFQYSKSLLGDNAFYSAVVLSKNRLQFRIPGTDITGTEGIYFVLNPDHDVLNPSHRSTFPITMGYNWPILGYLRNVDIDLAADPDPVVIAGKLFDLGLRVMKLSERQVVAKAINTFTIPADNTITAFEQFVADFNGFLLAFDPGATAVGPFTGEDVLGQLLVAMEESMEQIPALTILQMSVLQYDTGNALDWTETKKKLNQFFRGLLPAYDMEAYLRDLLLPKFSASLELSAAIEFPREMLLPALKVVTDGITSFQEIPETQLPKFGFAFQPATFEFHSKRGFTNNLELVLGSNQYYSNPVAFPPDPNADPALSSPFFALVPNVGLAFQINNLAVDLSSERNTVGAISYGQPTAFKGVHIASASVFLPPGFSSASPEDQGIGFTAENLLIGTDGSEVDPQFKCFGHFYLDLPETPEGEEPIIFLGKVGELEIGLEEFDLELYPDSTNLNAQGFLRFPNSTEKLGFILSFDQGVYSLGATYDGDIHIGNTILRQPTINSEIVPLVIEFGSQGIISVSGSFDVITSIQGNVTEFNASLGYVDNAFTLTASDITGVEFNLGPLGLVPNALSLSIGNSGFGFGFDGILKIKGIKATDGNGNPTTADKSYLVHVDYDNDETHIALSSPDPAGAKLLGFSLEMDSLDLVFNSSGVTGSAMGTILLNENQEQGGGTTEIDFVMAHVDGNWILSAGNGLIFQIGQAEIEFTQPLLIGFDNSGITSASATAVARFPKLLDENEQPAEIELTGSYNTTDENEFLFEASGLSLFHFTIGKITILPQTLSLLIENGTFESIEFGAQIKVEDVKSPGSASDRALDATLKVTSDYMYLEIDVTNDPAERSAELRGLSITLDSLSIAFDQNGFVTGQGIEPNAASATVHIESDNLDEDIQVQFSFDNEGFTVDMANQSGVTLYNGEQLAAELTLLHFEKENDNIAYSFGADFTTNISVPALSNVIPRYVNIVELGKGLDGTIRYNLQITWDGGFSLFGNNTDADSGNDSFGGYIPTDGLSTNANENVGVDQLKLSIEPGNTSVTIKAEFYGLWIWIGPFLGVVDGMGLSVVFEEAVNGNLGDTNVRLAFEKPKGIGVAIVTETIVVAGYLYNDDANSRYYGFLFIEVKSFGLDAIGVYSKYQDNFSFLAMVNMDFPSPIPLAFGFYLQKAGGIVGLHRTINAEAMREGIRTGALDQLFFPEDIIENITTILGQLDGYFPVTQGRHSFGLLFDLTYGESDMVHIELGLLLSVPQPIIVAIAGTVKVNAPDPDSPTLILNCAFLGVFDQGKQMITFDARIYNSQIAGIGIEGDIAARFGWGQNKMFMISAGGFHPQFIPDPAWGIGSMNRMALRIVDTDKLKIFVESYFAVTSNTFQIGARGELNYQAVNLGAKAYAGFDALFYFNPFKFTASVSVGAEVSWKDKTLAGVNLYAVISGPGIWNARGNASCEILCFDVNVNFDITWGNSVDQGLPPIDVQEILVGELGKNSSWKGDNAKDSNVVYRPLDAPTNPDDPELILSPKETITVNQLTVPFEMTIEKFGENPVAGTNHFKIHELIVGEVAFTNAAAPKTENYFAPNQFKKLNDQQRLQSQSYALMKSGASAPAAAFGLVIPTHFTSKEITYEQCYKGATNNPDESLTVESTGLVPSGNVSRMNFTRGGALGRYSDFRKNERKSKVKNKVRVKETQYSIVNKNSLEKWSNPVVVNSKSMAQEILNDTGVIATSAAKNLRVAPDYEFFNSTAGTGSVGGGEG